MTGKSCVSGFYCGSGLDQRGQTHFTRATMSAIDIYTRLRPRRSSAQIMNLTVWSSSAYN
jgi:hypothetical protein